MSDEEEMNALNAEAFKCELIYAYEDAIREDFAKEGRDIDRFEDWPVDCINRVPASLKEKLIPHLRGIFQRYRDNLKASEAGALSGKGRGK
jgi:hypothetical protein